jgi:hypothetical protein
MHTPFLGRMGGHVAECYALAPFGVTPPVVWHIHKPTGLSITTAPRICYKVRVTWCGHMIICRGLELSPGPFPPRLYIVLNSDITKYIYITKYIRWSIGTAKFVNAYAVGKVHGLIPVNPQKFYI